MTSSFITNDPNKLNDNAFKIIGDEWMLITSGNKDRFNMMTASWGGLGILWNKPVCFIFIRPQRYTYQFVEKEEYFTLSFFEKSHHDALVLCGSKSGRDTDKAKETGLIPFETPNGSIAFEQARLVLECRKWYYNDILPENFLDPSIMKNYPQKDFHRMYTGLIMHVLEKKR